ncbi:MAG TPA: NADH-quinone oxidoreductase subunit A [Candidatus Omnitrophota bacterium]|jgi:NADH:ubiquinone oxidoreductase subunit 3 (subunit A)|nr:MAG: NAD(P)H-quinone oxidoreductase subunit 3 [Candidatus Omnitrophica bacterium ADurb.Bin314]HOE68167.1 NADH-quinone oxidoreductase subunit A [Candidatus Omnitrophota bacterium]HQB93974.1 NADH-quinone oxidoreductase subunit A [Candidatus Omnitrophota bacterium]
MSCSSYFYQYLFVGVFFVFAVVFAMIPLILAWFLAPKKPSASKSATYECGLESKGDPWIQYRVQYYIFALIFVLFDIEVIFIYPWAVAFKKLGLFAFVEMTLFIAILAFGLIYAWKKRFLEWE